MRVTQDRDNKREEDRDETRVGSRVMNHEWGGDKGQGKKANPDKDVTCAMCGKTGHVSKACYHRRHPDANTANTPLKESVPGRAWAARGVMTLPPNS
jgi:hypothetical protein